MADSPAGPGNYYEILGVVRTATPKEIDAAFRNLARKWHPDVCADVQQAVAKFKRIAEAYEVLGDPEKRRRYDEAERKRRRRRASPPRTRAGRAQQSGHVGGFSAESYTGLFGAVESVFESLFASDWARPVAPAPQPRRELDVEVELPLAPEEARQGGPVQIKLRFDQTCPECAGRAAAGPKPCSLCGGEGRIRQGPGTVTIRVPPGVWNGSVIRVPGEGKQPPHGGPPGDLLLRIRIQPCW